MSDLKPKRMLVILAHPDDESFATGGTLAKYALQDVQVILLCATRGEAGIPGKTLKKLENFASASCGKPQNTWGSMFICWAIWMVNWRAWIQGSYWR